MKHWKIFLLIAGAGIGMLLGYLSGGETAQIGSRLLTGGIIGAAISILLISLSSQSGSASGEETGRRSFG